MELRSCSHLHFVQALRGCVVTKLLNLNHGRPALKFKKVKDLYENGDTKFFEVNPSLRPKFECMDLPFECDMAKAESLCTLTGEAQKVKDEDETLESKIQANAVEESGLADLHFANITLKQIKERCKEKKRKRAKCVNTGKETSETCSPGKRSHFSSQSEDEYDTMEPLICWKSRILKKKKKKTEKKFKKKSVSASSQNALSIAKFEEMSTDIVFQTEENSPAPIAIKVEFPEPTFSDGKDLVVTSPESPLSCIEPVVYYGAVSSKRVQTANGYDLGTRTFSIEPLIDEHLIMGSGMPVLPGEELMTDAYGMEIHMPSLCYARQISAVNEESYEEPGGATNFVLRTAISAEELKTEAFGFETPVPALLTNKPQFCAEDDESWGHEDHADGNDIQPSGGNKMTGGIAAVVCDQFPHLSLLEAKKEDSVTKQHQINNLQVVVSPNEDHIPKIYRDLQIFTQRTSRNSEVQVPDIIIDVTHELKEPRQGNGAHLPKDEAEVHDHVPARIIGSSAGDSGSLWNSNLSSSLNCSSSSVVDCHDEPVVTKVEEGHHSKLQHPPERLLSTRMAISPTSQKKLREAMQSNELDHEKYYKYARKLCYGNLIGSKTDRLEAGNQIKKAEVITSPKKAVRKPKIDSNGFHHNDNIKVPHASRVVQHNGIGCHSVRSCPESAILFSQQQLRDIESITTKLTKQLQFMKDIAEETLQYKVYPDASLRYSQNEIKIAIRNATRTEESAKRSLSIMARDCSRFCKIMKLAEKGSGTSSNMVRKKRKIVFADEAGGMLCDVKTFENDMHCE